jgi:hypothetical protein
MKMNQNMTCLKMVPGNTLLQTLFLNVLLARILFHLILYFIFKIKCLLVFAVALARHYAIYR